MVLILAQQGTDSIHDAANNVVGDEQVNNEELRVTDYHEPWEGIQEKIWINIFYRFYAHGGWTK